jgi:phosphoribosylcarboxyaminoimidazole (NCAIR) mutase
MRAMPEPSTKPLVAVIMGSQSDLDPMMIATSGVVEGSGMARIVAMNKGSVKPQRFTKMERSASWTVRRAVS